MKERVQTDTIDSISTISKITSASERPGDVGTCSFRVDITIISIESAFVDIC